MIYKMTPWTPFFAILPRKLITGRWSRPFCRLERRLSHFVYLSLFDYEYRYPQA